MSWLVVGLAAVLVALVVGTAPAAKDTLVIGMPTDVPIFDTHNAGDPLTGGLLHQVAEPLVRLTHDGQVVPSLVEASEEPSKDGRTWTLHTRKGVKFTDGTAFGAEALRLNLERFRRHSVGKATLAMVTSMEVAGEHALRVTTEAPFAPFVSSLGSPEIVVYSPTQILEVGDDNPHTAPVGTGPFKFVHHKRGQEVRLEANDEYWGGKPKLRAIVSRPYPDQGARMLALESGDVDLIVDVPPREAARLARNITLTVSTPPSARVIWVYLNTQTEAFKDKRVRQALYYAIDREAMAKDIFAGTATALHSPGPVGANGYTDKYDRYGYDPERARQLLEDAGAANLSFTLHHSPGRYLLSGQVVEAVQAYLEQVGVTMRVIDLEWGALSQLASQPVETNQVQAVLLGWRSVNGDIDSAIQDFGSAFWRPRGNNTVLLEERRSSTNSSPSSRARSTPAGGSRPCTACRRS